MSYRQRLTESGTNFQDDPSNQENVESINPAFSSVLYSTAPKYSFGIPDFGIRGRSWGVVGSPRPRRVSYKVVSPSSVIGVADVLVVELGVASLTYC